MPETTGSTRISRRGLLGGLAAFGAGAAAGVAGTALHESTASAADAPPVTADAVEFHGAHQAGIATPAQDRLAFASFDLTTASVHDVHQLLRDWTAAARAMCAGLLVGPSDDLDAPPADTGEAMDLQPAQLTITVGLGPGLFDQRFGLAPRRPAALATIPALPRDELVPGLSGGDLAIQACSNDPQVAFHAIRNLARLGRDVTTMRWSQLGFGRTSSTGATQATPRNLMGFKDGTRNIRGDQTDRLDQHVWVGTESDQAWMHGGSYMVTRRIRIRIEGWDRDALRQQEDAVGRVKTSGAPLGKSRELDTPDFHATRGDGTPMIPADSHVALAAPENNDGLTILRRGYSFTDGTDPGTGELDAGLFFIAYQKDPRTQFVPLQRKLGSNDALNEYLVHTSSAVFACPPGVTDNNDYWGSALFA